MPRRPSTASGAASSFSPPSPCGSSAVAATPVSGRAATGSRPSRGGADVDVSSSPGLEASSPDWRLTATTTATTSSRIAARPVARRSQRRPGTWPSSVPMAYRVEPVSPWPVPPPANGQNPPSARRSRVLVESVTGESPGASSGCRSGIGRGGGVRGRRGTPSGGSGANSGRSGGSSNGGGGGTGSVRRSSHDTSPSSSKIGRPASVGCSTGGAADRGAGVGSGSALGLGVGFRGPDQGRLVDLGHRDLGHRGRITMPPLGTGGMSPSSACAMPAGSPTYSSR